MSDTYSIFLDRPDNMIPSLSPATIPGDLMPTALPMTENFGGIHLNDHHHDPYGLDTYQISPVSDMSACYSYLPHSYGHDPSTSVPLAHHHDTFTTRPHFDKHMEFAAAPHSLTQGHLMLAPVPMHFMPEALDPAHRNFVPLDPPAWSRGEMAPLDPPTFHSHTSHADASALALGPYGGHPVLDPGTATDHMSPAQFMPVPFGDLEFHQGSIVKNEDHMGHDAALLFDGHYPHTPVRRGGRRKSACVGVGADLRSRLSPKNQLALSTKQSPQLGQRRPNRIIRGITTGGSSTRPPKQLPDSGCQFVPVELVMHSALMQDLCLLAWDGAEMADRRRIIRIERTQDGAKVNARFLVVGLAVNNPDPKPLPVGVDVIEVLCLQCYRLEANHDDSASDADVNYYITSVEVVGIVEMLIDMRDMDLILRRRERGRIRSNLMPFWLKKAVSSKKNAESDPGDPRMEFAKRIMAYKTRKPRGFDKDVRILQWDKLLPALLRALQCYYVEVPDY